MCENFDSLVGQMLVAMPNLSDPNFWHSVILLGVHSPSEGAFGLRINRSLGLGLNEVLGAFEGLSAEADPTLPEVLGGGPVEPSHGFVLYESDFAPDEPALMIGDSMALSGNTATLAKLIKSQRKNRYYLFLGYSGWAPGQLEVEIEQNSWLVAPIDSSIVFDVPIEDRWTAALQSIGVEPGTLVDVGSAAPS